MPSKKGEALVVDPLFRLSDRGGLSARGGEIVEPAIPVERAALKGQSVMYFRRVNVSLLAF